MSSSNNSNSIRDKIIAQNNKRWAEFHYVERLIAKCDQSKYKSKLGTSSVRDALQLFTGRPNLLGVAPNDKVLASIIKLLVAFERLDDSVQVTTKELRDLVKCQSKALMIGSLLNRTYHEISNK